MSRLWVLNRETRCAVDKENKNSRGPFTLHFTLQKSISIISPGAGGMAQSVPCLLHKRADLSLDPGKFSPQRESHSQSFPTIQFVRDRVQTKQCHGIYRVG